jgi:hypothetical protein
MKWTCVSIAPAVRMCPSPASTSVEAPITSPALTPFITPGLPALPIAEMRTVPNADVGLANAVRVDDDDVGDDQVGRSGWRLAVADCPMPSRITLPPPNFASSP